MSPETLSVSQSVLVPASDGAQLITGLTLWLIFGGALLFLAVIALVARGAAGLPAPVHVRRWIIGGGLVLPGVVLTALLVRGLGIGAALSHAPDLKGLEIEVVARRWWWELRYRDPHGTGHVMLANELHLPLESAAVLTFSSGDVIHSFWVPALAGKVDVIPGQRNRLTVHATRAGRFRGQCAEFCGTQHANMGLEAVLESPAQFRSWLLNQARPAIEPTTAIAVRGRQVFLEGGCGTCHTIRGTSAAGQLGPDLTHVAGRRQLAAATLENDPDSLMRWIRGAQHLKPGSLMPSMTGVGSNEDLRALATYLGSLH